jgi:hypothetical protein
MSTVPGDSTWADAGLVPPDSSQVQDPSRTTTPVEAEDQPRARRPDLRDEAGLDVDDYEPDPARPDRRGEAAEHDVLEEYDPPADPPQVPDDAPEPDVLEQTQDVPDDGGYDEVPD